MSGYPRQQYGGYQQPPPAGRGYQQQPPPGGYQGYGGGGYQQQPPPGGYGGYTGGPPHAGGYPGKTCSVVLVNACFIQVLACIPFDCM